MPGYLESLTVRLAVGAERVSASERQRHVEFLMRSQRADGGFGGREGGSDLYYTGFALRGLAILGELDGDVAHRSADFLRSRLVGQTPVVDFISLLFGAKLLESAAGLDIFAGRDPLWRQGVAAALENLRRGDGGYAKTAEGHASSVYHSFLVVICLQLLDLTPPQPDALRRFVLAHRRDDGGFVEMSPMRRSGTNPTAAAIGLLRALESLDDETRDAAIDFVADMQNDEGGLRANTRVPIADVLSTFTGLVTLLDLGGGDAIDLVAAGRYAKSLAADEGGFHGAAWDTGIDVEYTFYGMGTLALVAESAR